MKRKAESVDEERQAKKQAIHSSNLIGEMEHHIDLVDDIWQRIFFSFGQERARFTQVSKRWRNIILNSWRIFDNYKTKSSDLGERRRSSALLQFIKLRLPNLVDVSIELYAEEDIDDVLNTFLQIKTLRRLRLAYQHLDNGQQQDPTTSTGHWCKSLLTPRCNDLVLLNLTNSQFSLRTEALASLVAGVPNLEELYLADCYTGDLTPIYELKKLQRIYISGANNAEELAKNMLHLKYVVFKNESSSFSFTSQAKTCRLKEIGTTVIVEDNYMDTNDIQLVRKLKDLITPQHALKLSQLAAQGDVGQYFIFLVQEMKLDINYEPGTIPEYRLVSVDTWGSQKNAISALVRWISEVCRKSEVLEVDGKGFHIHSLKLLLDLGADPNKITFSAKAAIVPLIAIPYPESIMLLIERGMDIHKVVPQECERDLPCYFHVLNQIVPDLPELLTKIMKRVDINKEFDEGYTLLQHAITRQREFAINMLCKAGAKWTPAALEGLIDHTPHMFDHFVVKKSFDFKLLTPCAIFRALERGLLPELKEIVSKLPDERDSFGLTPMHHVALIHGFESPSPRPRFNEEERPMPNFQRWVDNETGFRPTRGWGKKQSEVRDATRFITPNPTLPNPDNDKAGFGSGGTSGGFSFGRGNIVSAGGFGNGTLSRFTPLSSLNMNDDIGYIGVTNSGLFGLGGNKGNNNNSGSLFGNNNGGFGSRTNRTTDLSPITTSTTSGFKSIDEVLNAKSFSFADTSNNTNSGGFSFGDSSTNANSGGFSFEDTSTNITSGGFSFGNTSNNATSGGFSFGGTNANSGGLSFGGTNANSGGFSFGGTNANSGGLSFGGGDNESGGPTIGSNTNDTDDGDDRGFYPSIRIDESSGIKSNSTGPNDFGLGRINPLTNDEKMDDTEENSTVYLKRRQECDIDDVLPLLTHCNINAQNSYGETPLLMLIKSNVSILTNFYALLQHGADPKIPDNNGWTPLHAALYVGSWSVATELITRGADVNAQDKLGITPLMALLMGYVHNHERSFDDFENEWFKLLTTGVNYKLVDKTFNRSLMHYIACVGSLNMANLIVSEQPDIVNARDVEGWTPLHYAVLHCNYNMVSFLLANGADPNAQTMGHKVTPAMLCTHLNQPKYLFNSNKLTGQLIAQHLFMLATPIVTREDCKSTMLAKYQFVEPPWTQSPRERVLQKTTNTVWNNEHREILRMIVSVSDPHVKDSHNSTLLHHLVHIAANTDDKAYYIMDLIRAQKEFMPYWSVSDDFDVVPSNKILEQVCTGIRGDPDLAEATVKLFKEHQIQIYNDVDDLTIVAKVFETANLKELLPLIDFNKVPVQVRFTPPEQRRTLLDHLILGHNPSPELFEQVLALQPQALNTQNTQGDTPLMVAVEHLVIYSQGFVKRAIASVDFFLSREGIDLNKQNNQGNTALHIAASRFNLAALDALNNNLTTTFWFTLQYCIAAFRLLEAKARLDIKNEAGKTPLDYCPRLIDHFNQYNELIKRKMEELAKESEAKYSNSFVRLDI